MKIFVLNGKKQDFPVRIRQYIPGIFVALGIFGTFLGLVLGLKGLKIDELANLKQGVGQLLSGLSLAFYTSLLGIALSVIFSFSYRFLIRRLEKAIFKLNELVGFLFPCCSYEHYARKYLELQADVKQGLQTMATDVAIKIKDTVAPALDEALLGHLVPVLQNLEGQIKKAVEESKQQHLKILGDFGGHLEKMSNIITDHFEDSQKKQSEAMEETLNKYVEKMNETFMGQFQNMGRVIEETTKVQSEIREQMVQFAEQLKNQFSVQTDLIEKTSRAAEILNESLDSLEGISRELKSSADDIASAATMLEEAASKAMQGQSSLRESLDLQIHAMTSTREELESAWNTITANTNSTVQLIREAIREFSEGVGEQLNSALAAFDGTVAEVIERFSGTLLETNQTLEELPGLITSLQEGLEEIGANILHQREIFEELRDLMKNTVIPNIPSAIEVSGELAKATEAIIFSTKNLEEIFGKMVQSLQSSANSFEATTRTFFEDFRKLSESFLERLNHNVGIFEDTGPLYSMLTRIDEVLSGMVRRPVEEREKLALVMHKLNTSLTDLRRQIEKLVERNKGLNQHLLNGVNTVAAGINAISQDIRNGLLKELEELKEIVLRMREAANEVKMALSQPEAKRGLLGIIRKR